MVARITDALSASRANVWRYPPGAQGKRHRDLGQEEVFVVLDGTLTDRPRRPAGAARGRARRRRGRRARARSSSSATPATRSSSSSSTARRRRPARPSSSTRCPSPPRARRWLDRGRRCPTLKRDSRWEQMNGRNRQPAEEARRVAEAVSGSSSASCPHSGGALWSGCPATSPRRRARWRTTTARCPSTCPGAKARAIRVAITKTPSRRSNTPLPSQRQRADRRTMSARHGGHRHECSPAVERSGAQPASWRTCAAEWRIARDAANMVEVPVSTTTTSAASGETSSTRELDLEALPNHRRMHQLRRAPV